MDRTQDDSREAQDPSSRLARSRQLLRRAREEHPTTVERSLDDEEMILGTPEDEESLAGLVRSAADDLDLRLQMLDRTSERLERVVQALRDVGDLGAASHRLEQLASDWEVRFATTEDAWSRAAREVPLQVAEATAVVIRSALASSRVWTGWTVMVSALVLVVTLFGAFWSWRAYATAKFAGAAVEALTGRMEAKRAR